MLLNDEFHPTTREVGFIEMPLADAAGSLETGLTQTTPVRRRTVEGELSDMLNSLLPLTSVVRRRFLLISTGSRWTAYFDNGWRGTDSRLLISRMAQRSGCLGMRAVANPASWEGRKRAVRWPSVMWEVYGQQPDPGLRNRRTLVAANDGGRWTFMNHGEPFDFEDVSRYGAPRIPDRFPVELLLDYLRQFEIELFDGSFYSGPGVLLEATNPQPPNLKEYATFAAARGG